MEVVTEWKDSEISSESSDFSDIKEEGPLNEVGLKFTSYEWKYVTTDNYSKCREVFGDVSIEMFLRHNSQYYDIYLKSDRMNQDWEIGGKIITPDFVIKDNTGKQVSYIEFKTFLYEPSAKTIESTIDEVSSYYGSSGKCVILCLDEEFPVRNKLKVFETKVYLDLRSQILKFLSYRPKFSQLEFKDASRRMPSKEDLFTRLADRETHPWLTQDFDMGNLNETVDGIWRNLDKVEEFANNNYLDCKDMGSFIPTYSTPNIHLEHLWDRDLNRIKSRSNSKENFGHRAQFLVKLPLVSGMSKERSINKKELKEIIKLIQDMSVELEIPQGLSDVMQETFFVNKEEEEKMTSIKENLKAIAFLKTEAKLESIEKIAQSRNLKTMKKESIIDDFKNENLVIIDAISKRLDKPISISKSGGLIFKIDKKTRNKTGIKGQTSRDVISKKVYTKTEPDLLEIGYFSGFKSLRKGILYKAKELANLEGAFSFNSSLESVWREDSNESNKNLNRILRSDQFNFVYTYWKITRSIKASVPRMFTKGSKTYSLNLVQIPEYLGWIFTSPSPNEITTGLFINLFITKDKPDPPEGFVYHTCRQMLSGEWLCMSIPYRENLKHIDQYNEIIGSFLGTALLCNRLNFNLWKEWIFVSLFASYTRQLSLMSDIIYLYYKNLFSIGNFGKYELAKKFEDFRFKDVRVVSIIGNLRKRWSNAISSIRKSKSTEKFNFQDPIFGIEHSSMQSVLVITYLKQLFLKDDGFDERSYIWKFFSTELEYQSIWMKSEFSRIDPTEHMDVDEFVSKVFVSNTEWEKITYHPDTCFNIGQYFAEEALRKDPNIKYRKFPNISAIDTGKSSKVLMPTGNILEEFYPNKDPARTKEEKREIDTIFEAEAPGKRSESKRTRYFGITSVNLKEALLVESVLFKSNLKKPGKNSLWNPPTEIGLYRYKLGSHNPTLLELAIFEREIFQNSVIKALENKKQIGHPKRPFFVQSINGRNANKITDESVRPLLKTIKDDIILLPGHKKLIKIEADLRDFNHHYHPSLIITEDETKFGDMYPMEALMLTIMGMKKGDYYADEEVNFILLSDENLRNRFLMLPWQCTGYYSKLRKEGKIEDNPTWENKIGKIISEYTTLLDSPDRFSTWTNDHIAQRVTENPGFKKTVGFTLGVLNMRGSVMTQGHNLLINKLWERMGVVDHQRTSTHSDDSISITKFSVPQADVFSRNIIRDVPGLRKLLKKGGSIIGDSVQGYRFYVKGGRTGVLKPEELSKLHILLTLITPRFVGQRPSLLKWSFGDQGEMLQTMFISGKGVVPLVRHACAITKDLPNHSPSEDLLMSSGRVYECFTNGGGSALTLDLILAINWYVYTNFSVPLELLSTSKPTQTLGMWLTLPPFLVSHGFQSNEARLWAHSLKDKNIERELMLMMNVEEVWEQRQKPNEFFREKAKSDQIKVIEEEVEEYDLLMEPETEWTGAPESRKDFKIYYNKKIKTNKSFFKIMENMRAEIIIETFKDKDVTYSNEKLIKEANKIWLPYSLGKVDNFIAGSVEFLSKYLTQQFQENYIRVPKEKKLVGVLGYWKRQYTNPFSKPVSTFLKIENEGVTLTIEEIQNAIDSLVFSEYKVPDICLKMANLIRSILSVEINELLNIYVSEVKSETLTGNYIEEQSRYFRIDEKFSSQGIHYRIGEILSIILEMDRKYDRKITLQTTAVLRNKPSLMSDEYFIDSIDVVRNKLKQTGFSYRDIETRARLLVRIFSVRGIESVIKLVYGASPLEQFFTRLYDFGRQKVRDIIVGQQVSVVEDPRANAKRDLTRAISAHLFRSHYIEKIEGRIRFLYRGKEVVEPKWSTVLSDLKSSVITNKKINYLISLILRQTSDSRLIVFGKSADNKVNYLELMGEACLIVHSRTQKIFGKDEFVYKIYLSTENKENATLLILMCSYYLLSKKRRITDFTKNIEKIKGSKNNDFFVTGPKTLETSANSDYILKYHDIDRIIEMANNYNVVFSEREISCFSIPLEQSYKLGEEQILVKNYQIRPWFQGTEETNIELEFNEKIVGSDTIHDSYVSNEYYYSEVTIGATELVKSSFEAPVTRHKDRYFQRIPSEIAMLIAECLSEQNPILSQFSNAIVTSSSVNWIIFIRRVETFYCISISDFLNLNLIYNDRRKFTVVRGVRQEIPLTEKIKSFCSDFLVHQQTGLSTIDTLKFSLCCLGNFLLSHDEIKNNTEFVYKLVKNLKKESVFRKDFKFESFSSESLTDSLARDIKRKYLFHGNITFKSVASIHSILFYNRILETINIRRDLNDSDLPVLSSSAIDYVFFLNLRYNIDKSEFEFSFFKTCKKLLILV